MLPSNWWFGKGGFSGFPSIYKKPSHIDALQSRSALLGFFFAGVSLQHQQNQGPTEIHRHTDLPPAGRPSTGPCGAAAQGNSSIRFLCDVQRGGKGSSTSLRFHQNGPDQQSHKQDKHVARASASWRCCAWCPRKSRLRQLEAAPSKGGPFAPEVSKCVLAILGAHLEGPQQF